MAKKGNRISVSGVSDELKAMVLGAEAIGIPKEELIKAFVQSMLETTEKTLGKHKGDALKYRQADLNAKIAELQKESKAIDGLLEQEKA